MLTMSEHILVFSSNTVVIKRLHMQVILTCFTLAKVSKKSFGSAQSILLLWGRLLPQDYLFTDTSNIEFIGQDFEDLKAITEN